MDLTALPISEVWLAAIALGALCVTLYWQVAYLIRDQSSRIESATQALDRASRRLEATHVPEKRH
jgi:hypothetical protein